MIGLTMDLKNKGIKIIILSNNFKERTEYYLKNFQFFKTLPDKIYFSWQTGFLKSDPRAYQQVLQENNLKSEEVLFFDDSDKNIEVAEGLGIVARRFNMDLVRQAIQQ
jgi:HAD superfamily hydrolase (TIGR01509 family)